MSRFEQGLQPLRNARGSLMVSVIISIALVLMGVFVMLTMMDRIYESEQARYYQKRIELIRQSLISDVHSDATWGRIVSASVNASAGFSCLASRSCPNIERPFAVFDASGVQLSDPTNPSMGLDINGNPCKTFSLENPDETCIARFEFRWIVDCTSCIYQAPRVLGTLKLAPSRSKISLNTDRLAIDYSRGKEAGTVAETCASMKGILDSVTGQCRLPFAGVPCGVSQTMNGTLDNGELNCDKSPAFGKLFCPGSTQPVGIDGNGRVLCAGT